MDRMVYVAMTGAKQLMQAQAVVANNLANVSTTGFRADLAPSGESCGIYVGGEKARPDEGCVSMPADTTGVAYRKVAARSADQTTTFSSLPRPSRMRACAASECAQISSGRHLAIVSATA